MFRLVTLGLSTENIDQIAGIHFIPEVFYTCVVMFLMCIFAFITYFVFKKAMKDPLKSPNGFVLFMTFLVEKIENLTVEIMGERNRKMSGYFLALMPLIFVFFFFCRDGVLPCCPDVLGSSNPPTLASQGVGMTGVSHCT